MATISVGVPGDYLATVVAAVRERYPIETEGQTDDEAARQAVKVHLKDLTLRYAQRHADVLAADSARETAIQARKDAEAAALAYVGTRFDEVA